MLRNNWLSSLFPISDLTQTIKKKKNSYTSNLLLGYHTYVLREGHWLKNVTVFWPQPLTTQWLPPVFNAQHIIGKHLRGIPRPVLLIATEWHSVSITVSAAMSTLFYKEEFLKYPMLSALTNTRNSEFPFCISL